MSKPAPTRYRTLNWSAYNAALRGRGSLTVWFDPPTPWHAAPSGKRGKQAVSRTVRAGSGIITHSP